MWFFVSEKDRSRVRFLEDMGGEFVILVEVSVYVSSLCVKVLLLINVMMYWVGKSHGVCIKVVIVKSCCPNLFLTMF